MQQLQNASDPQECAGDVLEAVLDVMLLVREQCARRMSKDQDAATVIHIRAMGVLRKRPGATLSLLAQQLALTLSATSRLVETLVGKGLVARKIPEGNRRTISLQLTSAGLKAHRQAWDQARQELAQSLESFSSKDRAQLSRCMRQLSQTLEKYSIAS